MDAPSSGSALLDIVFKRRKHHEACCAYIASNRYALFADHAILDLVFLGLHTTYRELPKVLKLPNLRELIADHKDFDVYDGWQKYCRALEPDARPLPVFGESVPRRRARFLFLCR